MGRNLFAVSALLLSLILPQVSLAQAKGYVGGVLGFSVPDYDDTSARPMFGIIGGARLDGEFGLGGFYFTSSKEESADGSKFDFNYSLYGLEGSFHFEGVADGAFVAARVGMAKVEAATANISPLVWGLNFGYDYFLNENFSLGAEAGFMSVSKGEDGAAEIKAFTMLNFLAAAKFWF